MISKEEAKQKIELLVNDFKSNFNIVKNYNEEETKRKLIEPLFEALGWNFQHQGKNSEVHYEHSAHKTKSRRVDYIVGKSKGNFLIEAKQVSKKLDGSDKTFIMQANNYSWNKGMFCVLTDFEEFQLIKPIKPNKRKPEMCIVPDFYELGFEEYVTNFDLFWDTFSKQAVEKGSLDLLLDKEKKKRKFYTIDDDFLSDLENWRQKLANNIYKNNTELIGDDAEFLGELTQRVLDRIIFTRILEDRLIEPNFIQTVLESENIYEKLNSYFKQLRPKYNGLIYNEHQIDNISIEDKVLKDILLNICDTDKNEVVYQFDQIPVEILGSIYERFLGKTLNIHPDKKRDCVTLEKTYLTKDTGIYYTPDYVVDYICENTIGKMFSKKSPQQVKDIKIIDTACGSGSFLVGAYTYLLNWYENYYNENPDKANKYTVEIKEKIREADGTFGIISQRKLSRKTRKSILTQHIFGVDIDHQAVEVTQMSLFLKMLEENYDLQMEFGDRELILPSLTDNIVCGNTLLDNASSFSKEEKKRLKPFNWEDFFPNIIKWETTNEGNRVLADGYGFDIIIGNPPYVKQYTNNKIFEDLRQSYIFKYYEGKMDYWYLFACQAIDLLKKNGLHSYIATSNWNTSAGSYHFRNKLLSETKLISLVDFLDFKVFQNAGIQTMIYIVEKKSLAKAYDMSFLKFLQKDIPETLVSETLSSFNNIENKTDDLFTKFIAQIDTKKIGSDIFTFTDKSVGAVLAKIIDKRQFELSENDVAQGIIGGPDKAFIVEKKNGLNKEELKYTKTYYTSSERYVVPLNSGYLFYIRKGNISSLKSETLPNIYANIEPFKAKLKNRRETKSGQIKYYHLHWPRDETFFSKGEKIVCAVKTKYPKFYFTTGEFYGSRALFFIKTASIDMRYLTALLNSNISYFYLYFSGKKQGDQLQIDKGPLLSVPIANPENDDVEKVTKLYDEMISSIEEYFASKSDYNKKSAKADVKRIDKQINQFFYEKYGLTKEDIELIENSLPSYEFLN